MEIGISTFGETEPDGGSGRAINTHRRTKELLEEIKLADDVGLDVFALGEHHRPEYVISSPEVVLAAAASITSKIRLSSAVTVLSSADPVRVFQNFASLDLVSDGRAEIMAGRGSFIESFPLFGFDLHHYDALFEEGLELLLRINENQVVTWKGKHRASISGLGVYPRPIQEKLPVWIAVGGTPESAVRAGKLGLPMTMAILGGQPDRFVPFAALHRQAAKEAGHTHPLPLAINVHFYLAQNSQTASDEFYPAYARIMNRVGRERGWAPLGRDQFEYNREAGPLLVGSPQQVVDKLLMMHGLFKNTRFLLQLIAGPGLDHARLMRSIELLGTEVAPILRKETAVS